MDPKRLLELSSDDPGSALERELLASLQPPTSAKAEIWKRLAAPGALAVGASAATVAAAAKASASSGAMAAGSGTLLSTAKVGIALAVAAPIAAGAIYVASSPAPAPRASAPSAAVVAPRQPEALQAHEPVPEPPASAEVDKAPSVPKSDRARPEASAISEENRLLREARAAARSGDAAGALATLKTLDRRFPGGALIQERELLRVQALRAQGAHAEAERRARRFLKLYPTSPYASQMKTWLGDQAP